MQNDEKILAELELANDLKLMKIVFELDKLSNNKGAKFAAFIKNNYHLNDMRRGKIDDMLAILNSNG